MTIPRWMALGALAALVSCGAPERDAEEPETPDSSVAAAPTPDEAEPGPAPDSIVPNQPDDPGGTEGWIVGTAEAPSTVQGGVALLSSVRTGTHPDYERFVIELSDQGAGFPSYHVSYIDKPLIECGSGEQVFPVGDAWLEIRMEPLDAHTQEGQPTVSHRPRDLPGLANLLRMYMTCDFEAVSTIVLAVRTPNRFRVLTLEGPRRIVVDIQR